MSVNLRYFTDFGKLGPIASQRLKLDPYSVPQECSFWQ